VKKSETEKTKDGLPFLSESFTAADLSPIGKMGVSEGAALVEGSTALMVMSLVEGAEAEAKAKTAKGIGFIEFVAGKAGIVNRNRREYSQTVYELAVERAQGLIEAGQFLGEVDHPYGGSLRGAAFRISKLYMDGDLMKAEAIILDTEGGRHLKALLEGGVGVAISTRGYGSAKFEMRSIGGKEMEVAVIQNDFRLEGIDAVLFPSNPAGTISRHENHTPTQENRDMTLETLRQEHPELVTQIEEAARSGFVAESEIEAKIEEARTAALESDEVKNLRSLLSAVVEAIRPFVPEMQKEAETVEQTEAEKTVAALTEKLSKIEGELAAERKRAEDAAEAQAQAEARATRTTLVESLLEGFEHAEIVRDELLALESEDAIRSTFEARKSFIESLSARLGVKGANEGKDEGQGTGVADKQQESDTDEDTKRKVAEARELAGL
jgi:hypothetical protein